MYAMKIDHFDILLLCAVVKISATQNGDYTHRLKRSTHAGYTQDSDTCKKYNENLKQMWILLSKSINSTDSVSEQALHNVAVMVKAYLDHQNKHKSEEILFHPERKNNKLNGVLKHIKEVLGTNNAIIKIKDIILENFKPDYNDRDPDCKQTNEDNLQSSIAFSYKNYLDNAKCRGDYDGVILRGKALYRKGPTHNMNTISGHHHDPFVADKNLIDQSNSLQEFIRGRIQVVYPSSVKRSRTNRRRNNTPSPLEGRLSSSKLGRTKNNILLGRKTRLRVDESCVMYANRKFLITLRASIKRFNELRDCVPDNTLRASNKKKKLRKRIRNNPPPDLSTPNECSNKEILLEADTQDGQQEKVQINNCVNKVEQFKPQNAQKISRLILVVQTPLVKKPLLVRLKSSARNKKPALQYQAFPNNKQHIKYAYNFDVPLKSSFDNNISPTAYRLHTLLPVRFPETTNGNLKPQYAPNGIEDVDLLKREKHDQGYTNHSLVTLERNSRDNGTFKVKTGTIEFSNSTNDINKDLPRDQISINFNTVSNDLKELQNFALHNTQIDVNGIGLNHEKEYVELSYLVKYPKSIVYRPQYLVKNILRYEDFIKVASQLNFTNDDKLLIKIVRHLPNNATQLLFKAQEIKSPLALFDVKDDANKGSPSDRTVYGIDNKNKVLADFMFSPDREASAELKSKFIERENNRNAHVKDANVTNNNTTVFLLNSKINNSIDHVHLLADDKISTDGTQMLFTKSFPENRGETYFMQKDEIGTDIKHTDSFNKTDIDMPYANLSRTDEVNIDHIHSVTEDKTYPTTNPVSSLGYDNVSSTNVNRSVSLRIYKNDTQDTLNNLLTKDNIHIGNDHSIKLKEAQKVNNTYLINSLQVNKLKTNLNDTDSLGHTDLDYTDSLTQVKISTFMNQADYPRQETIITKIKSVAYLKQNKVAIAIEQTDSIRKDKVNIEVKDTDSVRADVPYRNLFSLDQFDTKKNLDVLRGKVKIIKDILTPPKENKMVNGNKNTTNNNLNDSLRKSNVTIYVNKTDSLQQDKINDNINHADSLIQYNINTGINNVLKDKNMIVNVSPGFLQGGNITTNIEQADSIPKDKIESDDKSTDNFRELKNNDNVSNSNFIKDKFDSYISRADLLQKYKIYSNVAPAESRGDYTKNTTSNQTYSKRKDPIDIKDSQAAFSDQDETNIVVYLKMPLIENKILGKNNNISNIYSNDTLRDNKLTFHLNETNHADSLKHIKMRSDINQTELLKQEKNVTNISSVDSLPEDKIDTSIPKYKFHGVAKPTDSLITNEANSNVLDTYVKQTNSSRKIKTNPDIPHAESLSEIKVNANIDSLDTWLENKPIDIIVNQSDSKYNNSSNDSPALLLGRDKIHTKIYYLSPLKQYNSITENKNVTSSNSNVFFQENEIGTNIKERDSLLNNKIVIDMDDEDLYSGDKLSTSINQVDSLKANKIITNVNPVHFLQEAKIDTNIKHAQFVKDKNNANIKHTDSIKEAKLNVLHTGRVQEDKVDADTNDLDCLRKDKNKIGVNCTTPVSKNVLSKNIFFANANLTDSLVNGNLTTYLNKTNYPPKDEIDTDVYSTYFPRKEDIFSSIKPANSLQQDKMKTVVELVDSNQKYKIDADAREADPPRDTERSLLSKDKVDPYISHSDFVRQKKAYVNVNSTLTTLENNNNTDVKHADDLKKTIDTLPINKHDAGISSVDSLVEDKPGTGRNKVYFMRKEEIDIKPNQPNLSDKVDITTNAYGIDSLQIGKIILEDHRQGPKKETSFYNHKPISEAESNSHVNQLNLLPRTHNNTKNSHIRISSAPSGDNNSSNVHLDSLFSLDADQVDLERKYDANDDLKHVIPLPEYKNKHYVNQVQPLLNKKSNTGNGNNNNDVNKVKHLHEEEFTTGVDCVDSSHQNKYDNAFHIDANNSHKNYESKSNYSTYSTIAEGLTTSSQLLKANDIQNKTFDSIIKNRDSDEFINLKDKLDFSGPHTTKTSLTESKRNDDRYVIDAKIVNDYMHLNSNNGKISLDTASQAYMKQLETNDAADAVLSLRTWWNKWKTKLSHNLQSIGAMVSQLIKEISVSTLSNDTNKELPDK